MNLITIYMILYAGNKGILSLLTERRKEIPLVSVTLVPWEDRMNRYSNLYELLSQTTVSPLQLV